MVDLAGQHHDLAAAARAFAAAAFFFRSVATWVFTRSLRTATDPPPDIVRNAPRSCGRFLEPRKTNTLAPPDRSSFGIRSFAFTSVTRPVKMIAFIKSREITGETLRILRSIELPLVCRAKWVKHGREKHRL